MGAFSNGGGRWGAGGRDWEAGFAGSAPALQGEPARGLRFVGAPALAAFRAAHVESLTARRVRRLQALPWILFGLGLVAFVVGLADERSVDVGPVALNSMASVAFVFAFTAPFIAQAAFLAYLARCCRIAVGRAPPESSRT